GFRLRREVLRPVPLFEQLLAEGVAVGVALGVEAAARIAVPVPRTADPGAGLEDADLLAQLTQTVELVEAGDAGADDDRVEGQGLHCTGTACPGPRRVPRLRPVLPPPPDRARVDRIVSVGVEAEAATDPALAAELVGG